MCWGYEVAKKGAANGTDKVFTFAKEFDEDTQITIEQRDIAECVQGWNYGIGLSQWDLYFLEYLLWSDAKLDECRQLEATTSKYAETLVNPEVTKVKESLLNFDWETFKARVGMDSIRIVTRGAVEHWLAQDKAELKGDKDGELKMRHGFGNLALIDASTNSSLSKDEVSGKSKIVLQMSNPSLKLLWLAVFCSRFPTFEGKDVACITEFWARYLSDFVFPDVR